MNLHEVAVIHYEDAQRFEAQAEGFRALLAYRRFPDHMVITHTEVPSPLEGQGLAAKLARAALDFARANHLRVIPLCPYIASFIRGHSEYHDLVSADDLQGLTSRSSGATSQ